MTKLFEREVLPGFQDIDPAQVLFFSRYFELVHRAFEGWFVDQSYEGWKSWFGCSQGVAFPLRNVESRYDHPIYGGKKVKIEGYLVEQTENSLQFKFTLSVDAKLCAEQKWVIVPVDLKTFQKTAVPKWALSLLGI